MTTTPSTYVQWDGKGQPPPKERWQFYVKTREGYDPNKNGLHLSRWAPQNRHMLTQQERDKIAADARAEELRGRRQQAYKSTSNSQNSTASEAVAARSGGGIASSRWAPKSHSPPSSTKAAGSGPKANSSYIPPHMRVQAPVQKASAPQVNSVADATKNTVNSVRSLSPKAAEFKPTVKENVTIRSLSPKAAEFKPTVKESITPVRSLSPEAAEFKPSFEENVTSVRPLSPEAAEFKPTVKESIAPVRSLSPEAAEFKSSFNQSITPVRSPNEETVQVVHDLQVIVEPVSKKKLAPHLQVVANALKEHALPVRSLIADAPEFTAGLRVVDKPVSARKLAPHLQAAVSKLNALKADAPEDSTSYVPPSIQKLAPAQKIAPHLQCSPSCSKTASRALENDAASHFQIITKSSKAALPEHVAEAPVDAAQSTVVKQENSKVVHLPTPPKNGGLTSAADYSDWLKHKNERDLAAKKASIAQRAALQAQGPIIVRGDTWRQAPACKVVAVTRHSHFRVDVNQSPGNFQAFLEKKDAASAENGKKYSKSSKLSPEAPAFIASNRTPSPIQLNAKAPVFTPTPPPSLPSENEEKISPVPLAMASEALNLVENSDNDGAKIFAPNDRSLSPRAVEFTPNHLNGYIAPVTVCSLSPEAAEVNQASIDVNVNTNVEAFESIPMEITAAIQALPGLSASKWASADVSAHQPKSCGQKVVEVKATPKDLQPKSPEPKVVESKVDVPNMVESRFFKHEGDQSRVVESGNQTKNKSKLPISTDHIPITHTLAITGSAVPATQPVVAPLLNGSSTATPQTLDVDHLQIAKFKEWMANRNSARASTSAKTDSRTSAQNRAISYNQVAIGNPSAQVTMAAAQINLEASTRPISSLTHAKVNIQPHSNVATNMIVKQQNQLVSDAAASSGGWGNKPAAPDLNMIIAEAALVPTNNGEKLTKDILNENWGPSASNNNSNSFDAKISDEGVATTGKENVRNTQGRDPAEELLDWDNSWRPAPCDWEDRGNFDNSYMSDYIISDWQPSLPHGIVNFDLKDPDYNTGRCPVKNLNLESEYEHETTLANLGPGDNRDAYYYQTSENAAFQYNERELRRQQARDALAVVPSPRDQIQYMDLGPHEFAPNVDIYLRPAQPSDAAQIAAIYNHYVNTNPTEDLEPVTEAIIKQLGRTSKEEKLPFLVAIKGLAPVATPTRSGQNVVIPRNETILGFAVARTWAYGMNGLRSGRSRLTVNLEVFVDPDNLRKGIGRSLLDRLLQCCSPGYAGRDGYSWVNPNPNDDVYSKPGGVYYLYSLVIQVIAPAGKAKEKDDDFLWKRDFLRKYWFDEEAILKGFSRSSRNSPEPKFFDNVIFTKLAALDGEVPPFA